MCHRVTQERSDNMARININDFDDELLEKVKREAVARGCTKNDLKGIFHYVLKDYLDLAELTKFDNPLLIKMIQQTIRAELDLTESHLGGRLFKLVGDNTINLSVLTQLLFDNLMQFDDKKAAYEIMDHYRKNAVDQLRETKMPISYKQLIKEDTDE